MRPSKQVSESKSIISSQMLPSDANPMGFVHGGTILKLVDVAAGVTALRHTRKTVVTASLDRMDFYNPVYVGNLLTLKASLNYAGHTSMEVGVRIEAEELKTGKVTHTGSSYLTYVAMDESGNPPRSPTLFQRRPRRNADGEMQREGEKNVSGWSRWSRRKEQQRTLPNESRSHRLWNDGTTDSPSLRTTRERSRGDRRESCRSQVRA